MEQHREQRGPKVAFGRQVGYGTAEIGLNSVETALRLYLLIYYTDVVGLRPGLAGVAVALGLVFDAVTDPLMGAFSDLRREGRGGRHVFVLGGGVLLALGVVTVFNPPILGSQAGRFAWLLASYCFLNLGLTVMSVPYLAMAGELTADPHERSVLFGWRFGFANFGALLAAGLPVMVGGAASGGKGGIGAMGEVGMIIAGLVVVGAVVTWAATRNARRIAIPSSPVPAFRGLLLPLRNPTFRPLLVAYVVATIGIGVNAAAALYYYGYRLLLDDAEIQQMLVVFMLTFTVSIVAWVQLAKRYGKLPPLIVGAFVLGVSTSVVYVVLPPREFLYPLLIGAIGIGSFVGCIVLIESLLTDVIDHDRASSGRHRAGLYFGLWRFLSKLARAIAVAGSGFVLDAVGFQPGQAQSAEVGRALALLFGPGVGVFFLLAGIVLWRYRFTAAKQAQVQRILRRRA